MHRSRSSTEIDLTCMAGTTRPLRPRSRRRHLVSLCLAWLAALAVGLMLVAITVLTLWLVTSVQP